MLVIRKCKVLVAGDWLIGCLVDWLNIHHSKFTIHYFLTGRIEMVNTEYRIKNIE